MSQLTAMIVHRLTDTPEAWVQSGDKISEGYYSVALDATHYGMGDAKYPCDHGDKEILSEAMSEWKEETEWVDSRIPVELKKKETVLPWPDADTFKLQQYEIFVTDIRKHYKSHGIHKDAAFLAGGISTALNNIDTALAPLKKKPINDA